MYDFYDRKDELVATKRISSARLKVISDAIALLPENLCGFHFDGKLSTGAPMLRITFTKDGAHVNRQTIEIVGYMPDWAEGLIATISNSLPPELAITYPRVVSEYRREWDPNDELHYLHTMRIDDFYGHTKSWWEFWK